MAAVLLSIVTDQAWSQTARKASAMQRVTGVLRARHAMEPLDSGLAIRVYDARGAELAGVPVQWTLSNAGDGAALRVINATTDSLGVSRAELTPGRSADVQSAIAEVSNVGRIAFAVTIPAATLRIVPARMTLWSGDDTVMVAELRDARGTELAGGVVSWTVMDTTIVRVFPDASAGARVLGVGGGTTQLAAWVGDGKVRDIARATVRAVISGRVVTIDSTPPPGVRVEVRGAGRRDSIPVRDDRFTARFEVPLGEAVTIHLSPEDTSYHEAVVRVDDERGLERLVIALVPKSFRIDAGPHQGQEVAIDAANAMARVGGAPFWRLVPYSGTGPRKLLGWRESVLPLYIAFAREQSSETITAADSIAFWETARRMERDVGRSLFMAADASSDTARLGFIRVVVRSQSAEGHTFVAWSQSGDASEGTLTFRRAAVLRDPHVVTHELVHLLGFGHSGSWPTVAQPSGGTQSGLTPHDVAYIQLAMKLRRLQEATGARSGVPVLQK